MLTIPCVIFAGGKSSRMGEDKALLPFASYTTLTQYQHARLSLIFSSVYISCKSKEKFPFQAKFLEEDAEVFAPTAGFIHTLQTLKTERFFAISVDSPFIDASIIQTLYTQDKADVDATVAKTPQGIQALCGIYHRSITPYFEQALTNNQHKLSSLLRQANTQFVEFNNTKSFLNLNHPSQYQEALLLV
jgi:molybdopterin-guanine dinucleotide biosynthesis protein A